MNKFLIFLIIVILTIGLVSCSEKKQETKSDKNTQTSAATESTPDDEFAIEETSDAQTKEESGIIDGINAKQIFKQSCSVCHGLDGKLGANGSKDLSKTILSLDEKINIITKGKGVMIAFESVLSPEEIKAVAKYTEQLKG